MLIINFTRANGTVITRLKTIKEIVLNELLITRQTDLSHCGYIHPRNNGIFLITWNWNSRTVFFRGLQ